MAHHNHILMLLRHGKARRDLGVADCARPLAKRGQEDILHVARARAVQDACPELILCSSAERTRETAALFADALPADPDIVYLDALYLAAPEEILAAIAVVPKHIRRVAVVGHNMGLELLANQLANGAMPQNHLPTSGLAIFAISDGWDRTGTGSATLIDLILAKSITD